ncbi:hypothetical protein OC834_005628 [Tilletia horrida]|nr:hypothetical protein OC834_005628 [Tilletia horrida]
MQRNIITLVTLILPVLVTVSADGWQDIKYKCMDYAATCKKTDHAEAWTICACRNLEAIGNNNCQRNCERLVSDGDYGSQSSQVTHYCAGICGNGCGPIPHDCNWL